MERIEVLRRCDLFKDLDEFELLAVEKAGTTQTFKPGERITEQDDTARSIYVIEDGAAAIILELNALTQRQVQAAGRYDVVGWSALTRPPVYTATTKALDTMKVIKFDADELNQLFKSSPDIGHKVLSGVAETVARRLSHAYAQLLGVSEDE